MSRVIINRSILTGSPFFFTTASLKDNTCVAKPKEYFSKSYFIFSNRVLLANQKIIIYLGLDVRFV